MKKVCLLAALFLFAELVNGQSQKGQPSPPSIRPANETANQTVIDTTALRHLIKLRADEVSRVLLRADYEKMYELMHPQVRKLTGDKESFIRQVGNGIAALKSDGFVILSIENFDPEKIVTAGRQSFAIVPTRLRIKTPEEILVQTAYEVSISDDNGATWLFVGGSHGKENLQKLFPAIIGRLVFPESTLPIPKK